MEYEIKGWEQDVAGKFRYLVVVQGVPVSFKFHKFPTDEEVQAEAARYDALMQEQANDAPDTD